MTTLLDLPLLSLYLLRILLRLDTSLLDLLGLTFPEDNNLSVNLVIDQGYLSYQPGETWFHDSKKALVQDEAKYLLGRRQVREEITSLAV